MKTTALHIFLVSLLLLSCRLPGQKQAPRYYRIDKVKTVKGEITEIKSETSYHKNDFTVIYLKEKKSGDIYRAEVSPKWFYSLDLMAGSHIEVTGSHSNIGGKNTIMTRSITCQGEQFLFRDKHGFPMWRGTRRGKGRGSGKQRGGSGNNPQRGML